MGPIEIAAKTTVQASAFDPSNGISYGLERLTVDPHLALGADISFAGDNDSADAGILLNGQLSTDRVFQYHEWHGFNEKGMDAIIDLKTEKLVSNVDLGFQAGLYRNLYLPTDIAVSLSSDSLNWRRVANRKLPEPSTEKRIFLEFDSYNARYIRVEINNKNVAYSAEDRKDIPMPIYIDEIVVH